MHSVVGRIKKVFDKTLQNNSKEKNHILSKIKLKFLNLERFAMPSKEDKFIYENIIRDELFHSGLSRDERNILELYFAQNLTIETTAKMMEMTTNEVKDIIDEVINCYKESIRYSDFISSHEQDSVSIKILGNLPVKS